MNPYDGSLSRAFEFLNQFQAQSPDKFALGLDPQVQKGLLDIFDKISEAVGPGQAQAVFQDFLKATDSTEKIRQLAIGQGKLTDRLVAAQEGTTADSNILQIRNVLNALQFTGLEDRGELPAALEAAKDTARLVESFNQSIIKMTEAMLRVAQPAIEKTADLVQKHPEVAAAVIGGAGVTAGIAQVAIPTATAVGGALLLNRKLNRIAQAGKAAATVAETAIPQIEGFAARRATQAASRAATTRLAAGSAARLGAGRIIGGVAGPAGLIATMLAEVAKIFIDRHTEKLNREAEKLNVPFSIKELEGFKFEAQRLGEARGESVPLPNVPEAVTQSLEQFDDNIAGIKDQAKEAASALDNTTDSIGDVTAAILSLQPAVDAIEVERDLLRSAELQRTISQIRQTERDFFSVGPFGGLTAIPQQQELISARKLEIEALSNILDTLTGTDDKSRIRFNSVVAQIRQLELANRQDSQRLLDSFQGIGNIFGLGSRFSKIIVSLNQLKNLAPAIEGGFGNLTKQIPQLTGTVGPSKGITPRPVADVFGPSGFLKLIDAQNIQNAKSAILKITRQAPPLPLQPATIAPPTPQPEPVIPQQIIEAQQSIQESTSELIERVELQQSSITESIERELQSTIRELSQSSESEVLRELEHITENSEKELQQSISTSELLERVEQSSHSEVLKDMIRESMELQQSIETSQILESLKEMNTITQNELESHEVINSQIESQTISEVIRELQDVSQATETQTLNTTELLTKIIQETRSSAEHSSISETNNQVSEILHNTIQHTELKDIQEILASTDRATSELITDESSNEILRELKDIERHTSQSSDSSQTASSEATNRELSEIIFRTLESSQIQSEINNINDSTDIHTIREILSEPS